jgi:septal ring-binding cell division protein DamX
MGKKNDTSSTPVAADVPGPGTTHVQSLAAAPAMPALKTEPAPMEAPAKKKPAAKTKKKAVKKPAAKKAVKISSEEIALRAYFISEHRHHHGIHGDAHSDWIEAERQLKAERKQAAKKK